MSIMGCFTWGNAAQWEAGGTVAGAVIAFFGLGFLAYQLKDNRQQKYDESRPYVVVGIRRRGVLVDLSVTNTGKTPATNVQVFLNHPFKPAAHDIDVGWQKRGVFAQPVVLMAPNQEFHYILDNLSTRLSGDEKVRLPTIIAGRVEYGPDDLNGKKHNEHFIIDLGIFEGTQVK
jgi:hypothetical protein